MASETQPTNTGRLSTAQLLLSLLFLAHLPFVAFEFQRLWNLEHYQFFPFALLAFACLFYQRRMRGYFRWKWLSTILIVVDLLLLGAGYYLYAPLIVYGGAILLAHAVCCAVADSQFRRSLGYLTLLPLITLRLPQNLDLDVIHWLQKTTTQVAGNLLNHFGFLHLRAGNVLEFPGKRFLVEEACSGVQSLFTLLFLATLITCGYRRKIFHTILVLASAACFAGLMNVLRVVAISIAWSGYRHDLSVGWQHDAIGHAALVVAAALVYSADAAIEFFCAPVPDVSGAGLSAVYRNPVTVVWNRLFLVLPRRPHAGSDSPTIDNKQKTKVTRAGSYEEAGERELPNFLDLLRPGNQASWLRGFVEAWFLSRDYFRLAAAIPFLVIGVGGAFFLSWLKSAPSELLVAEYEAAANESLQQDDPTAAGLYLRGLVQLRPQNSSYRFRLALHLVENEQVAESALHWNQLTGPEGYTPARLWLVNQATQPDPYIPLSPEQIEQQLRTVLVREPQNGFANQMLAEFSLQKGQFKLAEDYLLKSVERNPHLSLPLAKVQQLLKRSREQIEHHLDVADRLFESQLLSNPSDDKARIHRVDVLLMKNEFADAEQTLKEGISIEATPELQHALARVYSMLASKRLRESILNRDHGQRLVGQAMALDPSNTAYLLQALKLTGLGAIWAKDQLQPAIDALRTAESPSVDDQVLLARSLAMIGDVESALEVMMPLAKEDPGLRRIQAQILKVAGRDQEVERLTSEMLAEYGDDARADELSDRCDHAELLLLTSQFAAARDLLKNVSPAEHPAVEEGRRFNVLYGRACVGLFDETLTAGKATDSTLDLLNEAIRTNSITIGVIERLARLSTSDSTLSESADDRLTKLLAAGNATAEIYNLVGTSALNSGDTKKAKRYLERAYSMSRANPMVLNNLAIALVRDSPGNADATAHYERALQLANDALAILPEHPDVLSTRGEILIAQHKWEAARRDLEVALPNRQKSVNIRRLLVRVFEALDEPALAAEHGRHLKALSDDKS